MPFLKAQVVRNIVENYPYNKFSIEMVSFQGNFSGKIGYV